jgi:hypothetical protein
MKKLWIYLVPWNKLLQEDPNWSVKELRTLYFVVSSLHCYRLRSGSWTSLLALPSANSCVCMCTAAPLLGNCLIHKAISTWRHRN